MIFRFNNLPQELSFLVQSFFGLDEFYVSLSVCKALRAQGLFSRELLLLQLQQLYSPTAFDECLKLDDRSLRSEYLNIARKDLRGSNIFGDIFTYLPSYGCIDPDKTIFRQPNERPCPAVGVMYIGLAIIHIYHLTNLGLTFKTELRPMESPFLQQDGSWKIHHIVFIDDDYGSLATISSRPLPESTTSLDVELEEVNLVLIQVNICPRSTITYGMGRRKIGHQLGLITLSSSSIAKVAGFCISPETPSSIEETHVELNTRVVGSHNTQPRRCGDSNICQGFHIPDWQSFPQNRTWPAGGRTQQFVRFECPPDFPRILFYARGIPVHICTGDIRRSGHVLGNARLVYKDDEQAELQDMLIGLPFDVIQEHHLLDAPDLWKVECARNYISLAINPFNPPDGKSEACLVVSYYKKSHDNNPCFSFQSLAHGSEECGFRMKVACFEGYEQGSTRNGTVTALSERYNTSGSLGRRHLAAAFNRRVLVWSFDVGYLIRVDTLYRHRRESREEGPFKLTPIELFNDMDINKLVWSDENTLWAVSHQGIRQWKLGPHCNGQRQTSYLRGPLVPGEDYIPRDAI